MHKPLFRIAVGSVAAVGGLLVASAMPAGAATSARAETMARTATGPSEGTIVTFTVTTLGALNVTVPSGPVSLGSGAVGTTISHALGQVTVTDYRATNPSNWTVTVSSTDFTTGSGSTVDTIPAGDATYTTGTIGPDILGGAGVGSGLPLTAGIIASGGIALSTGGAPIVTETGADGDNAATWDPNIAVAVPALAVAGLYTGTITHSVS